MNPPETMATRKPSRCSVRTKVRAPGVSRTLRRMGFRVAIVSGGFTPFTDWLRDELQLDHAFANELAIEDGRLTGGLAPTSSDGQGSSRRSSASWSRRPMASPAS